MLDSHGYAASEAHARLAPYAFKRRDPCTAGRRARNDALRYLSLRHSLCAQRLGIHPVSGRSGTRDRRSRHAGRSGVIKFKVGDLAAIGCLVDSCRQCSACMAGEEHMCDQRPTPTYCGIERGTSLPTYGGYSTNYVVDQRFALKLAAISIPLPPRRSFARESRRTRRCGIGRSVRDRRSASSGSEAWDTSASSWLAQWCAHRRVHDVACKVEDAERLGAHEVVLSKDSAQMRSTWRTSI